MSEVENIVDGLLDAEENVGAVAVLSKSGNVVYQTENWDLTAEVSNILGVIDGGSSLAVLGVKYMIVENTPERIIGTNITGKGHMIIAPFNDGALVTFIIPQCGPRDALFNVQETAAKLHGKV